MPCISKVYIIFSLCLYALVCGSSSGDIKEYCSTEKFKPTCENDEVIILTQAVYGRMQIGKCVSTDYGNLGCKIDVLQYFDSRCSGKNSCVIDINDQDLRSKLSCLGNDLNPYLNASYICQKVFIPSNQGQCNIEANPTLNFLASSVTQETSCGLNETPWLVSAKSGQRLKLLLQDFSRKPNSQNGNNNNNNNNNNDGCPGMVQYGYIVDIKNNNFINICGHREAREIVLYTSSSYAVQIVIADGVVAEYSFIIKYEVIGCPEIILPTSNHWMQKNSNTTILMGCHTSSDTWRLTCVNNNWLGMMRNCSAGTDEILSKSGGNVDDTTSFNSNHVLAFSLGCVTLIVCCATVIVGFYCIKKYDSNRNIESPPNYDNATIRSTAMFNTINPATYQATNNNNHHSPLVELASYPFATMAPQHRNKPPPVPKRSTSYHGSIQRCHLVMHSGGNPFFPTGGLTLDPMLYQQEQANHQVEPMAHGNSYISQVLQPQKVTQHNEVGDGSAFSQNSNFQSCSLIMDSNITNSPHFFLGSENPVDTSIPTFSQGYNNNNNNEYCVEKDVTAINPAVPVHDYFVLENLPRQSVTSETDSQLYQSIHYKSTDNITS